MIKFLSVNYQVTKPKTGEESTVYYNNVYTILFFPPKNLKLTMEDIEVFS